MFFNVSGLRGELQMKNPQNFNLHSANYLSLSLLSILEKSSYETYFDANANSL